MAKKQGGQGHAKYFQWYAVRYADQRLASMVVRRGDDYPRVFIQAAVRKTGLGIDMFDDGGKMIKQYPELSPRQMQPLRTMEPVLSPEYYEV
ncbi:hypothetical protein GCM10011511_15960 [Puia dinghuensis]|uniref:Uncharacterized protein n=1 Tax=Puia dinghuensis TaxID=1792502 RepID=A0A8J2XSA4_9BACT|nr:hypothetical protein GCM10011511_15960 [Puia dinghuensis]